MQHPAVPELAHTRTRPIHWLTTATALAAVVALATLTQPRNATAAAPSPPPPAAAASAPDPGTIDYPMRCGTTPPQVQHQASTDLDHDGHPETIAVVRCAAGSGTPPSGIYVITAPPSTAPRIVATLVDPADRLSVSDFAVQDDTVTATLYGYSTPDVPRCCPDQQEKASWQWKDGTFLRSPQATAHSL
ncbi:hypothetical protein [Streptomyces apocyni]|uniref:hypothetical protein n=1 Tax=Streptomyces apocyni TaxID=2654677 RepID=UPI0012EA76AC|nr:hypothetical protein [Streptomyces apocyni]